MGSLGQRGLNAILESTVAHQPIAEIIDFGDFGATRADLDVTSHDSSGNAEEFIAGLIAGGDLTMTCNLDATDTSGQLLAITALTSAIKKNWTIRLPNSEESTYQFYGHVKSYKIKSELKGVMKITLVWKISHAPVFTA